jgi:hypothetical protein
MVQMMKRILKINTRFILPDIIEKVNPDIASIYQALMF